MNWELFGTAFGLVFVAELGDKTQLTAFSLAASQQERWVVFVGASLALVVSTALGVGLGAVVGQWVQGPWIQRAAGLLFIAIGAWYVLRA